MAQNINVSYESGWPWRCLPSRDRYARRMPILERTPFRWSHIVLPMFYLTLGAMIGYVAPIMWEARPGKSEVELLKETIERNRSQLLGE